MDVSVDCNSSLPSPSPMELAAHSGIHCQDPADRARERLLTISQAYASCDLQDVAKSVVGEKGVKKEEELPSSAVSLDKAKEDADEDEVYRKKLISISYDETPLDISRPNGVHVALPPAADGHGQPPA